MKEPVSLIEAQASGKPIVSAYKNWVLKILFWRTKQHFFQKKMICMIFQINY